MWYKGTNYFYLGGLVYPPVIIEMAGEEPNPRIATASTEPVEGVNDTTVYEEADTSSTQGQVKRNGGGAGEAPEELVIHTTVFEQNIWR